jgi:phosphoglycerate dehydrogenase-like enzyme
MKIVSLFPEEHHSVFWTADNLQRVKRLGELIACSVADFSIDAFTSEHTDAEVILTTWGSPRISAEIIGALPRLRVLAHAAGSVKTIFDAAAWERNIVVLTAAEAIGRFVGEMTLTLALCGLRHIVQNHQTIQNGGWSNPAFEAHTLFDARVGLAGFGFTARHAARLFKVFTGDIRAYDPFVAEDEMRALGVGPGTLDEIFETCKVVSLHLPNFPETRHLINAELLNRLQPDSVLVNTARGAVIATDELVSFLRERNDVVALLDVTDPEPLPVDHVLRTVPNVVLTPHISGGAYNMRPVFLKAVLDDLEAVLTGREPQAAVAPDKRERMA